MGMEVARRAAEHERRRAEREADDAEITPVGHSQPTKVGKRDTAPTNQQQIKDQCQRILWLT